MKYLIKKRGLAPRPGRPGSAGFTLVEMLISVALFSVVMVVALGALLSMSVSIRRAEAINSGVNNLASAIDSMSRSVRTGVNYHCGSSGASTDPKDCPTPNATSFFSYMAYGGSQVTYCLSNPSATTCNTSTSCASGSCTILRKIDSGAFVPLTATEVNIRYLAFYLEGSTLGDTKQPKVTMVVSGTVPITANQTSNFNIQTAITQRVYDQ